MTDESRISARNHILNLFCKEMSDYPVFSREEERAAFQELEETKDRMVKTLLDWFGGRELFFKYLERISLNGGEERAEDEEGRVNPEKALDVLERLGEIRKDFARGDTPRILAMLAEAEIRIPLDKALELVIKTANIQAAVRNILAEIDAIRERIVKANLRFVISVASEYSNPEMELKRMDLVQEGIIGLMKAADKFDVRRGNKFVTYAGWWVRQAMTRAIMDQERTIRTPVYMIEQLRKLISVSRRIFNGSGRRPANEEIAEKLGWPPDKVAEVFSSRKEVVSLHAPVDGGDGETEFGDFIADTTVSSPEKLAAEWQLADFLDAELKKLKPMEKKVLRLRFGIGNGNREHTLQEIGDKFGFCRERARQIEECALVKMRRKLEPKRHQLKNFF